jgi:hypothetical protein
MNFDREKKLPHDTARLKLDMAIFMLFSCILFKGVVKKPKWHILGKYSINKSGRAKGLCVAKKLYLRQQFLQG